MNATEAVELIKGKLLAWSKDLVEMLPNFLLAVAIVFAGWLLARLVRNMTQRVMRRVTDSNTLNELVSSLFYLIVILVGAFAALSILQLDKTVTTLLAGAGIVGLALGFAFQDIASNFIAGVIMAVQRPLRRGELVETSGETGTVERIFLRTTELRNLQGLQVIIPNKDIFQSVLINFSRNGTRRVDLPVGVSYAEDLEHVKKVSTAAVEQVPDVLLDRGVDLFYQGFGDSSIDLEVRFWVTSTSNRHYQLVRSNAIMAVKAAFDREGITIPFPIRTLDFGIKGGAKLNEMIGDEERKEERPKKRDRSVDGEPGTDVPQ
jgi:small-conductance mechanosensitive channel